MLKLYVYHKTERPTVGCVCVCVGGGITVLVNKLYFLLYSDMISETIYFHIQTQSQGFVKGSVLHSGKCAAQGMVRGLGSRRKPLGRQNSRDLVWCLLQQSSADHHQMRRGVLPCTEKAASMRILKLDFQVNKSNEIPLHQQYLTWFKVLRSSPSSMTSIQKRVLPHLFLLSILTHPQLWPTQKCVPSSHIHT